MAYPEGLEPPTNRFGDDRSAAELRAYVHEPLCNCLALPAQESNLEPSGSEPDATASCASGQCVVVSSATLEGLEPSTTGLTVQRSA